MSKESLIGKDVVIVGDHVHSGRSGVIDRFEVAHVLNREGAIVKFSNGDSCFVFSMNNLQIINNSPVSKRRARRR